MVKFVLQPTVDYQIEAHRRANKCSSDSKLNRWVNGGLGVVIFVLWCLNLIHPDPTLVVLGACLWLFVDRWSEARFRWKHRKAFEACRSVSCSFSPDGITSDNGTASQLDPWDAFRMAVRFPDGLYLERTDRFHWQWYPFAKLADGTPDEAAALVQEKIARFTTRRDSTGPRATTALSA